ncbi:MAG: hypothetical protein ACOYNF_12665 [Rhodoferax sp.]
METSPKVINIERIDDIPLLLAQMKKMGIPSLLDTHFPTHGNWQGLRGCEKNDDRIGVKLYERATRHYTIGCLK